MNMKDIDGLWMDWILGNGIDEYYEGKGTNYFLHQVTDDFYMELFIDDEEYDDLDEEIGGGGFENKFYLLQAFKNHFNLEIETWELMDFEKIEINRLSEMTGFEE